MSDASENVFNAELSVGNVLCSLCDCFLSHDFKEKFEIPYACRSCEEKECDLTGTRSWLCNFCVMSHIRRGHEVLDERGYEVSVCSKYKSMIEFYCETCSRLLCGGCLGGHSEHKFVAIHEKSKKNSTGGVHVYQ